MLKYSIKRIILIVPVLIGISLIIFFILALSPGNTAKMMLGERATTETIKQLEEELGLNKPIIVRYADYMVKALKGNFGNSYKTGDPVVKEIKRYFPVTLRLALIAICIALVVAIPIGIVSAVRQYSMVDSFSVLFALLGASFPQFWLGMMFILLFALKLRVLPAFGLDTWKGYILPSLTLSLYTMAVVTRMTRSSMLEVIRQDYIKMALSKGASENRVIYLHALRNALLPIVTIVGINLGNMLGGAIIIEAVFSLPGMGSYVLDAIRNKNIPAVMAGVMFLATTFCLVNLLVDLLYGFIDPRIKSEY